MSAEYELHAEVRENLGTGHNRRLRRINDKIPAVIYGADGNPEHVSFAHNKITKALENEAFYSHILTLVIGGKKQKAVLKAMQRHPFKAKVLHMDFLRVSDKEKILMHVPLHFIGEDIAPGVKTNNGIVSHLIPSVDVSCFPADLPEYLEIDISKLDLDETVHLSDIKLPKGVELVELSHGHDKPVASIHLPRAAVEAEAEAAAAPVPAEVPTHRDEEDKTKE